MKNVIYLNDWKDKEFKEIDRLVNNAVSMYKKDIIEKIVNQSENYIDFRIALFAFAQRLVGVFLVNNLFYYDEIVEDLVSGKFFVSNQYISDKLLEDKEVHEAIHKKFGGC